MTTFTASVRPTCIQCELQCFIKVKAAFQVVPHNPSRACAVMVAMQQL